MQALKNHLIRCFVAGVVAILPVAGLVVTVVYFEQQVAGVWLKDQGFYFFGLGLLVLTLALYLIGLIVTSLLGRWLFGLVDRTLDRLPILGGLYQTLKQIVGYGDGPHGLFKRVVWVQLQQPDRRELGLVTREATGDSEGRVTVFVPSGPTPTSGRLLTLSPDQLLPCSLTVSEGLQWLVSLGTLPPNRISDTDRSSL